VTSATLSAGGDFSYFLSKLGLDPRATASLAVGSTFDFGSQVLGLAPLSTPPDAPAFPSEVARAVAELVRRVGRKILVLFTSHALLREVHAHLQAELPPSAAVVLGQGVDGQREHVTRAFRSPGRAVLLGTASFWEGVDFPGEELEVLVLTRLPFPVPGDPLVEAQCEKIEAEGESAFTKLMVPEAVLRFRQGFGRLIRRSTDRGVFLVLDGRIRTAGYRERFRDALPIPLLDTDDVEEAVRRASAWFETGASVSDPSRTGPAREGDRR
jgi:ATP-dependent DNA helicase DinG